MSEMVGRPAQQQNSSRYGVRERLLDAAAQLFTALPYEKVSTRGIAERAGSNIGMIRYYFGNKAGLFEAICQRYINQVLVNLEQFLAQGDADSLGEVIAGFYATMAPMPGFPKLIQRAMSLPQDDPSRQIIQKLFTKLNQTVAVELDKTVQSAKMRPGLEPKLVRMTIISLMNMPFLMPKAMWDLHGININQEFLGRLAEHHKALLKHGFAR